MYYGHRYIRAVRRIAIFDGCRKYANRDSARTTVTKFSLTIAVLFVLLLSKDNVISSITTPGELRPYLELKLKPLAARLISSCQVFFVSKDFRLTRTNFRDDQCPTYLT